MGIAGFSIGCKGDEPKPVAPPDPLSKILGPRVDVPETQLQIRAPKDWQYKNDPPEPAQMQPPTLGNDLPTLHSRILLKIESAPINTVAAAAVDGGTNAQLSLPASAIVLRDDELPTDLDIAQYSLLHRASNLAAGASVDSVDTEPIERQGRRGMYLRTSWHIAADAIHTVNMVQEALILLDAPPPAADTAAAAGNLPATSDAGVGDKSGEKLGEQAPPQVAPTQTGFVVVVTAPANIDDDTRKNIRAMLESVAFVEKKPSKK